MPKPNEDHARINTLLMKGTRPQRETLLAVTQAHPAWFRSRTAGERHALAALFRAGVVTRRAYRGAPAGDANAAFEYALSDLAITAWRKEPRIDDPRGAAQVGRSLAAPPAPSMVPMITVTPSRSMTECACCGAADGTVQKLTLGWQQGTKLSGATCASLCKSCRKITAAALAAA